MSIDNANNKALRKKDIFDDIDQIYFKENDESDAEFEGRLKYLANHHFLKSIITIGITNIT